MNNSGFEKCLLTIFLLIFICTPVNASGFNNAIDDVFSTISSAIHGVTAFVGLGPQPDTTLIPTGNSEPQTIALTPTPYGTDNNCQCPSDLTCCNGKCTNIAYNENQCGGCGSKFKCPQGSKCCSGKCTNLGSDPQNCGQCENDCGINFQCVNGACKCPLENIICYTNELNGVPDPHGSKYCTDPKTDISNCGGCFQACGASGYDHEGVYLSIVGDPINWVCSEGHCCKKTTPYWYDGSCHECPKEKEHCDEAHVSYRFHEQRYDSNGALYVENFVSIEDTVAVNKNPAGEGRTAGDVNGTGSHYTAYPNTHDYSATCDKFWVHMIWDSPLWSDPHRYAGVSQNCGVVTSQLTTSCGYYDGFWNTIQYNPENPPKKDIKFDGKNYFFKCSAEAGGGPEYWKREMELIISPIDDPVTIEPTVPQQPGTITLPPITTPIQIS